MTGKMKRKGKGGGGVKWGKRQGKERNRTKEEKKKKEAPNSHFWLHYCVLAASHGWVWWGGAVASPAPEAQLSLW